MNRKTALILGGGGAKGAFQCGAEKYAREVKGYHWDIIAGVSVGALNAAMMAMGKYQRLYELWNVITPGMVYTGGFNLPSLVKIAFGAQSFYGNDPLRKLLLQELEPDLIQCDLRIGAVSLMSGEYVQFTAAEPNLTEAIMASTVMPIVWMPLDVSFTYRCMVDGGVRNITPIGDVLDAQPDEIVIIHCNSERPEPLTGRPKNILDLGMRVLDLVMNEIFRNDMREFLRINALVKEAAAHGITLHSPTSGKPLKYYDCKIIEPDDFLGGTLDFSQPTIQRSLAAGIKKARQVLGR